VGLMEARGSGGRPTNEAKGGGSLPKTVRIGGAGGGSTAGEASEGRQVGMRQGGAGHARRHSRGRARVMRRKLASEAASGGGGFADQAGEGGQVKPDVSQEDEGLAPRRAIDR
jgi:hypothetical protein